MLAQVGRHRAPLPIEVTHGGFEIGSIPQHDHAGDRIEHASAVPLGLRAVIADAHGAMEEDRALEHVLRLAFVQLARDLTSFLRPFDLVEREQRALNAADFAQRQCQTVRPRVAA